MSAISQAREENPEILAVACVMKQSRQADLCKQGLLHMAPCRGIMFFPVETHLSWEFAPTWDAMLVKSTDFLEEACQEDGSLSVTFTQRLKQVPVPHHSVANKVTSS
jgi:hypothetical protein